MPKWVFWPLITKCGEWTKGATISQFSISHSNPPMNYSLTSSLTYLITFSLGKKKHTDRGIFKYG